MDPPSLDNIPFEIIHNICEYVNETHKPSLQVLAITTKRLRCVAVTLLFRTIKLTIRGRQKLIWEIQLLPIEVIQHIRHLAVNGSMPVQKRILKGEEPCDQPIPRGIAGKQIQPDVVSDEI